MRLAARPRLPLENCTILTGSLAGRDSLRYTPAGIAALNFSVAHVSEQMEAGVRRHVECEVHAVALGPAAMLIAGAKDGDAVRLGGFLAAKSLKSRALVLHVNEIEFLEGNNHGIQTEG